MGTDDVRNAAYFVRHYSRPGQEERRAAAVQKMARAALAALARGEDSEAVLYAVAVGLYDRRDPRFIP